MVAKGKTRIFVECTQTFFKGGNSGIQRVVRNLANNGRELTITDAEVYPLIWVKFGFCQPTKMIDTKTNWLVIFNGRIRRFYQIIIKRGSTFPAPRFLKKTIRDLARRFRNRIRRRRSAFRELPFLLKVLLFLPQRN